MQNGSAWGDGRHAPGGLGGACVQKPACAWLPPICVWENARWHGWLVVPMGGTREQTASLPHAPPKTPRRVATVAHSATIPHTATLRFSTPQGSGGAGVLEARWRASVPHSSCKWTMTCRIFSSADGGHSGAISGMDTRAPQTPRNLIASFSHRSSHNVPRSILSGRVSRRRPGRVRSCRRSLPINTKKDLPWVTGQVCSIRAYGLQSSPAASATRINVPVGTWPCFVIKKPRIRSAVMLPIVDQQEPRRRLGDDCCSWCLVQLARYPVILSSHGPVGSEYGLGDSAL